MKKIALLLVFVLSFMSVLCSCDKMQEKSKFDNEAATAAYREYVKDFKYDEDVTSYYNIADIDGDGTLELLTCVPGTLTTYTYKADEEETVQKIGEVDYQIYKNAYRSKDAKKYPGLFVYDYAYKNADTVGIYSYITIKDDELVKEKIWDERACTYNGEKQNVVTYYKDKQLVEDAKAVFDEKSMFRWFTPGVMNADKSFLPLDFTKDEEYNYKIMLYSNYLTTNRFSGEYALYDVNGDSFVELLTYSEDLFEIFSLENDAVKRMYACTCDKQLGTVSVLKNGDILTEYNNGIQNYIYDDLGSEFETISTVSFGISNADDETEYTFAAQTVTKEEWNKQAKKYLESEKAEIEWLPKVYREYEKYKNDESKAGRDIGPFLLETGEMIKLEGKYYQSFVNEEDNIRYILVSQDEYEALGKWQWVSVGTKDEYSLDNLGKIK